MSQIKKGLQRPLLSIRGQDLFFLFFLKGQLCTRLAKYHKRSNVAALETQMFPSKDDNHTLPASVVQLLRDSASHLRPCSR